MHFFWGAADLAVTRFSGRPAPAHPGGIPNLPDWVAREAYSHEVSSCGFWAGGGPIAIPRSIRMPIRSRRGLPRRRCGRRRVLQQGSWEFILPYDRVRLADSPDDTLLEFLQSTYEAAATLANWDRQALNAPIPDGAVTLITNSEEHEARRRLRVLRDFGFELMVR